MKTRENELHEPKIDIRLAEFYRFGGGKQEVYCSIAYCPICNRSLREANGKTKDIATENVLDIVSNYCPNCGARLKEIEE